MKIGDINPVGKAAGIKKKGKSSSSGGFSLLVGEDEQSENSVPTVSGAGPIASLDSILATQSVSYDQENIKRQIKHGDDLLNYLEEVRMDLLSGNINPGTVKQLAKEARQQNNLDEDPKLTEIINEIETRAEVELAKIEYFG